MEQNTDIAEVSTASASFIHLFPKLHNNLKGKGFLDVAWAMGGC